MKDNARPLTRFEKELTVKMLLDCKVNMSTELIEQLNDATAAEFEAGDNYGSIELIVASDPLKTLIQNPVAEMVATDSDGQLFSALLHVKDGKLYLLEFFKPDGSPLIKRPEVADFRLPS